MFANVNEPSFDMLFHLFESSCKFLGVRRCRRIWRCEERQPAFNFAAEYSVADMSLMSKKEICWIGFLFEKFHKQPVHTRIW